MEFISSETITEVVGSVELYGINEKLTHKERQKKLDSGSFRGK